MKLLLVLVILVMSEGDIRDDAGVLYAHATATCMILRSST